MPLFPPDHALRLSLADELHARPPEAVVAPARASYVAVRVDPARREEELAHLAALCTARGVAAPPPGANHFRTEFAGLCLKWERHGEFSGYTVIAEPAAGRPFSRAAAAELPEGWLAALPGETVAAVQAELLAEPSETTLAEAVAAAFAGETVVGAAIAEGAARVFSDFRLHEGCTRFVLADHALTERQAGRTLQRLFEIEAYRVLALLALPIARRLSPRTVQIETALAALTERIARDAPQPLEQHTDDDEALLHELTRLAAEVESGLAASQFRFGACRAYFELVQRRIGELREARLPGVQPIEEFMARRLTPAVDTCTTVSQRLHDLSERVSQASHLLSTRVNIARERQSQQLLASMDRRARLQLRLQQTVEGLSVAAICYYAAGLVGYGAKALKAAGLRIDPDLAVGLAIPVLALAVFAAVRRAHRFIAEAEGPSHDPH